MPKTVGPAAPRITALIIAGAVALLGVALAEQTGAQPAHAATATTVAYDSIPNTLAPNYASEGFSAEQVSEFGQAVTLVKGGDLASVSAVFSSFACGSGHWYTGDCETTPGTGYQLPVTVNVYAPGAGGAVGARLASSTVNQEIPFRPSLNADCTAGNWRADDGTCSGGLAFTLDFPFATKVTIPANVVIGITFPLTSDNAKSLNVAVSYGGDITTSVGTAGDVYVNGAHNSSYYCDERNDAIVTGSFHSSPAWGEARAGGDPCAPLGLAVELVSPPAPGDPAPPVPTLPTTDQPEPTSSTTNAAGDPLQPAVVDTPAKPPTPGDSLDVTYPNGTFTPFEWVQFVFYSVPQYATQVQANAAGGLSASVPIPAGLPAGDHTLAATGTVSGVVSTAAVAVAADPALAATGIDALQTWTLGTVGAGAVALGLAAMIAVALRRRSARG